MSPGADDRAATPRRDPHPELSAPIIDLSLEAQISRAERAVLAREARVRSGARRIVADVRAERSVLVKRAAMVGAAGLAVAAVYVGYRALRKQRRGAEADAEAAAAAARPGRLSLLAELTLLANTATRWALRLREGQGVTGTIFKMVHQALWPPPPPRPGDDAAECAASASSNRPDGGASDGFR